MARPGEGGSLASLLSLLSASEVSEDALTEEGLLLRRKFREFIQKEHSMENLLFWAEAQEVASIPKLQTTKQNPGGHRRIRSSEARGISQLYFDEPTAEAVKSTYNGEEEEGDSNAGFVQHRGRQLYKKYVAVSARLQVNLPADMVRRIEQSVAIGDDHNESEGSGAGACARTAIPREDPRTVFADAAREIFQLMERDACTRFFKEPEVVALMQAQLCQKRQKQRQEPGGGARSTGEALAKLLSQLQVPSASSDDTRALLVIPEPLSCCVSVDPDPASLRESKMVAGQKKEVVASMQEQILGHCTEQENPFVEGSVAHALWEERKQAAGAGAGAGARTAAAGAEAEAEAEAGTSTGAKAGAKVGAKAGAKAGVGAEVEAAVPPLPPPAEEGGCAPQRRRSAEVYAELDAYPEQEVAAVGAAVASVYVPQRDNPFVEGSIAHGLFEQRLQQQQFHEVQLQLQSGK